MKSIHDIHERFIFETVSPYGERKKNFRNEPTEQLISLRKNCKSYVAYQPPYYNSIGVNKYNDISVYNEELGIDCRIEIKSLVPKGSLKNAVYEHIMEARNIVEKEMIILLFGEGYDEQIIKGAKQLISESKVNVQIMTDILQLKEYFKPK